MTLVLEVAPSVVLMAANAVVDTLLHCLVIRDMQAEAVDYWLVSVPVVVLGAPFGAFFISRISRLGIAVVLYVVVAQFVGAVVVIRPGGLLAVFSAAVFAFGLALFFLLTRLGRRSTAAVDARQIGAG